MKMTAKTVSIRDAARRLGVSIRFIRNLVWSGQLQAEKVGKIWQVSSEAVEARRKAREVHDAGR